MNEARRVYLGQRLAPHVAAVEIDRASENVKVTLACGHILNCVPHHAYKVGWEHRCNKCGEARVTEDMA
jgi:hypothetical protein